MSASAAGGMIFRTEELLPERWAHFAREGPVRAFNPGLLRASDGWVFAYRIVGSDGLRRIGLCRLDDNLHVVAGSPRAFSDDVRFRAGHAYPEIATRWFADPRLYRFRRRHFMYWNSGWHEPQNHQFIQEFDGTTLAPIGIVRELLLPAGRQKLEKNWTLFGEEPQSVHAVYSVLPHRVLACSLAGDGDVVFAEAASIAWGLTDYPASHGGLRGGAPPQRVGDGYWSFCHTVHDGAAGYRYAASVYRFAAESPFAPTHEPVNPLQLGPPLGEQRLYPRLNPAVAEVIYPCGAAHHDGRWWISYGLNDEQCAIVTLEEAAVAGAVRPLARLG
ncbi:MAG TPA: hypothetical protein VM029_11195 [Opitutaceae bacterium]|nr:hypothetical protein [Opitutaceae bacterium]